MRTQADLRKQFIKAFERLAHHRERHDVLADFLEMAVCALRKTTLPPGPAADQIEAAYMGVVARNAVEDVRAMPELLAVTALAVQDGGSDFLGKVVGELELINGHMGQFFTPYDRLVYKHPGSPMLRYTRCDHFGKRASRASDGLCSLCIRRQRIMYVWHRLSSLRFEVSRSRRRTG